MDKSLGKISVLNRPLAIGKEHLLRRLRQTNKLIAHRSPGIKQTVMHWRRQRAKFRTFYAWFDSYSLHLTLKLQRVSHACEFIKH